MRPGFTVLLLLIALIMGIVSASEMESMSEAKSKWGLGGFRRPFGYGFGAPYGGYGVGFPYGGYGVGYPYGIL